MPGISKYIKDPFPGLSHFFGAILSVAALVVLLVISAGKPWQIVAFSIYGASLILLYLASGISHSVHCSPAVERWLDRCDYMAIFVLIAGTYTPVCLLGLRGAWGWSILSAEWLMAAVGITVVVISGGLSDTLRSILYVAMGWLAIIAIVPVLHSLSSAAIGWMLGGGVLYSVGAVVFVLDRPHIWPGWFHAHDLWHCMVLGGSACHFVLMLCMIR